jgi:hypothetical protein
MDQGMRDVINGAGLVFSWAVLAIALSLVPALQGNIALLGLSGAAGAGYFTMILNRSGETTRDMAIRTGSGLAIGGVVSLWIGNFQMGWIVTRLGLGIALAGIALAVVGLLLRKSDA